MSDALSLVLLLGGFALLATVCLAIESRIFGPAKALTLHERLELSRLRAQQILARAMAQELQNILQNEASAHLPAQQQATARYALAAWSRIEQEANHG